MLHVLHALLRPYYTIIRFDVRSKYVYTAEILTLICIEYIFML
jgi:hypothetical protein